MGVKPNFGGAEAAFLVLMRSSSREVDPTGLLMELYVGKKKPQTRTEVLFEMCFSLFLQRALPVKAHKSISVDTHINGQMGKKKPISKPSVSLVFRTRLVSEDFSAVCSSL